MEPGNTQRRPRGCRVGSASLGSSDSPAGLGFSAVNYGWAFGGSGSNTLVLHWNGSTWARLSIAALAGNAAEAATIHGAGFRLTVGDCSGSGHTPGAMKAVTGLPRLLVVDDEATILELLSGSPRLAGFEVVTAASGAGAVPYSCSRTRMAAR